jgi:acetyltransferase-like isoleucine patch superfamily enzyme
MGETAAGERAEQMGTPLIRDTGIRDVKFGNNVVVHQPVNIFCCEIGDDVMIGPFVEIQRGVRIGARCRVQSHAFICEGVTIGDDCFVSHGVMFINDRFDRGGPARGDRSLWKTTTIGERVSIGTGAILLPVCVCSGTVIGAGAVVTKDIVVPGIYIGNPAKLLRQLGAEGAR